MSGEDDPVKSYVSGISLRLRDPRRDVGAMLEKWGLAVGRSWMAGEPRSTPRGGALPGVWPDCYAYAPLPYPSDYRLRDCLDHVLDGIEPYSEALVAFVDSGGYAELFVHWHFEENSGDELGWRLLKRLSDYRVALSFDVYPH